LLTWLFLDFTSHHCLEMRLRLYIIFFTSFLLFFCKLCKSCCKLFKVTKITEFTTVTAVLSWIPPLIHVPLALFIISHYHAFHIYLSTRAVTIMIEIIFLFFVVRIHKPVTLRDLSDPDDLRCSSSLADAAF